MHVDICFFLLVYMGLCVTLLATLTDQRALQEMTSTAQRLGPEIIAVLDSFLQSSNMVVG